MRTNLEKFNKAVAVPSDLTGIAQLLSNNAWNTSGANFLNAMASLPGMVAMTTAGAGGGTTSPGTAPDAIQFQDENAGGGKTGDGESFAPEPTNTPSKRFNSWNERYNELVEFKRVHGHCNVPSVYDENPALTQWVKRQRYQHTLMSSKKHSVLTPARYDMLERIGFIWSAHEASWEESYEHLVEFRNQYGHCRVPTRYPPNQQLATWVKMQRRQFRLLKASSKKGGGKGGAGTTTKSTESGAESCDESSVSSSKAGGGGTRTSSSSTATKEKSHMTWDRVSRLDEIGFEWDPRKLDKPNKGGTNESSSSKP